MHRLWPVLAVALVAAACGDAVEDPAGATTTSVTVARQPSDPYAGPPDAADPDEPATTTTTRPRPDGEPAPDFTVALGEGGSFTLSDHDRPVYLVFWSEWCPICRGYMPVVDEVAVDYGDDVTFLAVAGRSSLEASRERVGAWFSPDRLLWAYDDSLWSVYLVRGQPVSFLISSDGIVVDQWFGAVGEADLRVALDRLVEIG